MPSKKDGTKISWKEFFRLWKLGIENITPLQRLSNETRGTFITLLGFIASLIAVIIMREKIGLLAYGLILIFIGSAYTTGIKYFSLKQQLKYLKDLEEESKGGEGKFLKKH